MSNDVPDKEAEVPERMWIWHGIAEHGLNRDYYVSNSNFRGDDIEYIRTSHAIALISAKRDEWQKQQDDYDSRNDPAATFFAKFVYAANELLALLTGENKDSECEAKGDLTTTDSV